MGLERIVVLFGRRECSAIVFFLSLFSIVFLKVRYLIREFLFVKKFKKVGRIRVMC